MFCQIISLIKNWNKMLLIYYSIEYANKVETLADKWCHNVIFGYNDTMASLLVMPPETIHQSNNMYTKMNVIDDYHLQ